MDPADLASTLDTLKIIARLESAMAEFYRACAEAWAAENAFWLSLEEEERQHIQNIQRIGEIITERQTRFERNRAFNAVAIQTFISYVETSAQRVRTDQFPRAELAHILAIARDMEQSIVESKYNEIVKTADVEYQTMIRKILADTVTHKNKIAAKLAATVKAH